LILTNPPQLFEQAGDLTGCTFQISESMKPMIAASGFENVTETVIKTPIGGWAADPKLRELGRWALLGFDIGLEGFAMATLTRVLNASLPALFFPHETDSSSVVNRIRLIFGLRFSVDSN
jgi:hypothetical protein